MEGSVVKPTRYVIQEKHFSLNDKFVITDELGEVQFTVDSKLFSMGDKLRLYDASGKELIKIHQENLHLHPTYTIDSVRQDADEMQLASIKRTGLPGNHKLEIHAVNGEYLMKKDNGILSHDFTLTKDGEVVAIVSKDTSPLKCVYWVEISSDRDEYRALIMAMVIVLSCVSRLPGAPLGIEHVDNVKV